MTRMQHKGKAVPLCASFGKAKALSVIHKWWHCGLICVWNEREKDCASWRSRKKSTRVR